MIERLSKNANRVREENNFSDKIKIISSLQSIPNEVVMGFLNSKGKLELSKSGKLKIAKNKK